jgi:hypothetical protein
MTEPTFATAIRDGALARLQTNNPGVATFRTTPLPPTQAASLPSLGVYLAGEQMTPDGDYDAGEPKFLNDVTIGFSAVNSADSQGANETALNAIADKVLRTLLCDGSFMMLFEGITSIRRAVSFQKDGDTYFAEVRLAMTVRFRSLWPPEAPYALEEVDVYATTSLSSPTLAIVLPQAGCLQGVGAIGIAGSLTAAG